MVLIFVDLYSQLKKIVKNYKMTQKSHLGLKFCLLIFYLAYHFIRLLPPKLFFKILTPVLSMFQKLECVARAVRNSDKPFGGLQVILCGDFLQLPPVSRTSAASFAFQTKAWQDTVHLNIELTEVRRQNDNKFIDVLQEIRQGR